MKIALIGYGAMGQLIHRLAERNGHEVVATIGSGDVSRLSEKLTGADVAIDFSTAGAVRHNVEACMAAGVPLVEGTTGWGDELNAIREIVTEAGGAFVYGANFSIGVNLFYRISGIAAELFSRFPEYIASIEEQHHARKKDAPSGTALMLKQVVAEHIDGDIQIESIREGDIPGTHILTYKGPVDEITLEHKAQSRNGFAAGALTAAEWIIGKKGFYEFSDAFDEITKK